jgi:hypothetical protein
MPLTGFGTRNAIDRKSAVPALPSFFIIGPPRTGTSWLHTVLSECTGLSHPTKETRFFDQHYDRGLDWYGSHYRTAAEGRAIGEVAPTYFASREARERIAGLIPKAKIVCTFRNPVDRVVSLYRLKRAYGWIRSTFEEALTSDPEFIESSRYAAHLKAWHTTFGPSQVMATVHEDMQADPQSFLDKVVDFVGAPRVQLRPAQIDRVFTADSMTEPRNYRWTRAALHLANWSKARHLDAIVDAGKRLGALKLFIGGGPSFPEVPPARRAQLRELFRGEVTELEGMLNRDLSAWK